MLPPYIIEQLRERERKESEAVQPQIELELPRPPRRTLPDVDADDAVDRGIAIIPLWG